MIRTFILSLTVLWGPAACDLPDPIVEESSEQVSENIDSSDNSFNQSEEGDEDSHDNSQGQPATLPDGLASKLVGNWTGACNYGESSDDVVVLQFTSSQWALAVFVFEQGSACQGDPVGAVTLAGTFTVDSIEGNGLINWDLYLSSKRIAPYHQDLVDYYNSVSYYGYTDWELGAAKECINRADEDGLTTPKQQLYSTMVFSEDGQLALGAWSQTMEERSDSIDWPGQFGGPFVKIR